MTDAPNISLDRRLDATRGDIAIELYIIAALIEIARAYIELGLDDRLIDAVGDVRDHVRRTSELAEHLARERQNATVSIEAAEEFRADRESRRRL